MPVQSDYVTANRRAFKKDYHVTMFTARKANNYYIKLISDYEVIHERTRAF